MSDLHRAAQAFLTSAAKDLQKQAKAKARCIDCKHAQFSKTPTGRVRNEAGRCAALLPAKPIAPCLQVEMVRWSIWPTTAGHCDFFEAKDKP